MAGAGRKWGGGKGRLNADDVEGQKQIEKGGALGANGDRWVVIWGEWLVGGCRGWIGLDWIGSACEISWRVGGREQGEGVAVEK